MKSKEVNYMLAIFCLLLIMVLFTGCAKDVDTQYNTTGIPEGDSVTTVVAIENANRLSLGQALLQAGLSCNIYTVPNTTTAIIGATLTNVGSFLYTGDFDTSNLLPSNIASLYQSWYVVKCTGSVAITDNNWHNFTVASDDGSNLYVDGLFINNDGVHSSQTKSAAKYLKRGIHTFELDYLQATGASNLFLSEDGSLIQGLVH